MFEKLARLLAHWHAKLKTLHAVWHIWHARSKHWHAVWRVSTFIGILARENKKLARFWDANTLARKPRWHASTLARKPRWHAGTLTRRPRWHAGTHGTWFSKLKNFRSNNFQTFVGFCFSEYYSAECFV